MKRLILSLFLLTQVLNASTAQSTHFQQTNSDATEPAFRAVLLIGHTAVPSGLKPEHVLIPSWGLDVEYWPTRRVGVGLHSDVEVENFVVVEEDGGVIERQYPLISTLELLVNPWRGLVLQAGPGIELEQEKSYAVMRYGIEYEIELHHHWDLAPTIFYDSRFGAFDTYSIALGVGKRF